MAQSGSPYADLLDLVGWLNSAATSPGKLGAAWKAAEEILSLLVPTPSRDQVPSESPTLLGGLHPWRIRRHGILPRLAVRKFNALAREAPVRLTLIGERTRTGMRIDAALSADDMLPIVLRQVWQALFLEKQLDRLKRCDRCARWFVDQGANRRARFCGAGCEQRWWTRARRRLVKEGRSRRRRPIRRRGSAGA
jgi:hypothetical protein